MFRLCNWFPVRRLRPWMNHLPHVCWSIHSRKFHPGICHFGQSDDLLPWRLHDQRLVERNSTKIGSSVTNSFICNFELGSILQLLNDCMVVAILPKIDVPYLWIWLLYLVSINSACRLPYIITDHLCIPAINHLPPVCCSTFWKSHLKWY